MHKNILIADDDMDDMELYMEAVFLSKLPVTITPAGTCDEILEVIKLMGTPDLVIIDGNMPFKTIDECVSAIRSARELNEIPLIVLSGATINENVKNYYDAGVNLYLTKPDSIDETINIFSRLYNADWNNKPVLTAEEFFNKSS
ncbi:response regulator [Segetibacter koreensis]|uniref:response regulator n=1 Tax=Segetibacter koreensis TaxID=398037 RepID=UPI00035E3A8B|nr:response regulator [Segetibacter koreensis]